MYCWKCGGLLEVIRDLRSHWAQAYRCSNREEHAFIQIIDTRWIYPLLELKTGVAAAIAQASDEMLTLAFSRVKSIDYKTISIIFFEYTLLGCYDPTREYRVVYPDGSST